MNPLDLYADPDPCEPADDFDPDLDRDRREAEAIEDAYDAWVDCSEPEWDLLDAALQEAAE